MFRAVLGLFSQDLAVDLGSSRTRIHSRGSGTLCDEPTVVTVHSPPGGRRRVLCVGDEAHPMLGRTPEDLSAIQPVRNGSIVDHEVAEALLLQLVRRATGGAGLLRPRMAIAVPMGSADAAVRALRDSCEAAGAREVHLVPRAIAAALGAELPIHEPNGHLVVDLGGGSTTISVLSLSSVVHRTEVPGGGEGLDAAIVDYVRRHHGVEIGLPTAEHLKVTLASALPGGAKGSRVAKGRCVRLGIPRAVEVDAHDVHTAIAGGVAAIGQAIRDAIRKIPPELGSDVVENGVVLVGGGAALDGIEAALRYHSGMPVVAAEHPDLAVVRGALRVLEEVDLMRAIAS